MPGNLFYEMFKETQLKFMKYRINEVLKRNLRINKPIDKQLEEIIIENYINPLIAEFKSNGIADFKDLSLPIAEHIILKIKKEFEEKMQNIVGKLL